MSTFQRLSRVLTMSLSVLLVFCPAAFSADSGETPVIFVQMGHTERINATAISRDAGFILSGSYDKSIKLWDAAGGRLIRTFMDKTPVNFVRFLPGGTTFVSVNDTGSISTWDLGTGERIKEIAMGKTKYSSLDSSVTCEGNLLRAVVDSEAYVVDLAAGTITPVPALPENAPAKSYFYNFDAGFKNVITKNGRRMLASVKENRSESMNETKYKKMIYWDVSTGKILATLTGHQERIDAIILSPDETMAASGSRDNSVRVWDLRTGEPMAVLNGHQKAVVALAFSPDQAYLLSGSADNTMKLWDIDAREEIRTFPHDCPVTSVRFSADGCSAISGDYKGAVHIWDIKTGREVETLKSHALYPSAMDVSADGRQMVTGSGDGEIRLWDAASGTLQRRIPAHGGDITALKLTPDGRSVISAGLDHSIKMWDLKQGTLSKTFSEQADRIYSIAVSPDGRYALSFRYGKDVRLWDVATGREVKTFNFPGNIKSIGFTEDSRHVIIGFDAQNNAAIQVLTLDGKAVSQYDYVRLPCFSNDGRYFLAENFKTSTGGEAKLFEPQAEDKARADRWGMPNRKTLVAPADGKVLGRFGRRGIAVYLSVCADKDLVLLRYYGDQEISLRNVRTGRELRKFPAKFGRLSPDGKKVIAATGKTLQSFDTDTGRALLSFKGSSDADICALELSAKGGYAVTGDISGAMQFWDVAAGQFIKPIKETPTGDLFYDRSAIGAVAFSPDNKYAAALSNSGTCKIWNLRDGSKASEFKIDYTPIYYDALRAGDYTNFGDGVVTFSPDGRFLASGSHLWEIPSGRKALDFQRPFGPGPLVAFSPDGRHLISRNGLWDVSTGQRVKALESIVGASRSIFSMDGTLVYATDNAGTLFVADAHTGKLINKMANFVPTVAFNVSPDQKTMVAAETDTGDVSLWSLPEGDKKATIALHQPARNVWVGADSRKAVLQGLAVKTIDLAAARETAQFINFTDGEWIVITPEGYYNASANGDQYLNVRVGNTVYGIDNYREAFFRPDLVTVALSGGSLNDFRRISDIKTPPAVDFIDPPQTVDTDAVTLNIRMTDTGGGIGDIRLYLNGSAVVMEGSRALRFKSGSGKSSIKTYTLKLSNGKNSISAVAFNSDNNMQSNPAVVEITAAYSAKEKPSIHALVIGIDEFKNPKLKLNYPVADANLFAETLTQVSTGLFDTIDIRKLISTETTTNRAIMKELDTFRTLRPDDVFVFYIASHGTVDDGMYYLITSNVGSLRTEKLKTNAITQQMLKEAIANIPATKKLIIIDTCNAGALGKAIQMAMMTRGMSEDTAIKILSRAMGSTVLSASTAVQEALEGYKGHGLFTYVLAQGLKGEADKGRTGYVKTTALADYVDDEVPVLAEKVFKRAQYPTISVSGQAFPIGRVK